MVKYTLEMIAEMMVEIIISMAAADELVGWSGSL